MLKRLVADGWLHLPGTVDGALASRPKNPAAVTVPSLLPGRSRPFAFGKTTRSRICGRAQKAAGDRKIRKKEPGTAARLLALCTAAHARPDGRLGHAGHGGLRLDEAAAFCTLPPESGHRARRAADRCRLAHRRRHRTGNAERPARRTRPAAGRAAAAASDERNRGAAADGAPGPAARGGADHVMSPLLRAP
ncbi:hypothetical protein TPA0909_31110 [Streptomyces albus]|nr:hypothetical protein TPA0909_31110 [Streptomyces albus]